MRQLARAGLGEINAVIGAQPADLALEVRALLQEAAGFVDKFVPDIDIGDAGLAGGIAVQRIQEQNIGGRPGAANRGQSDPQHWHALGFRDRDHLFDFLGVEFDPAILAEFINAVRRACAFLGRRHRRYIVIVGVVRQFSVGRLVVRLCGVGRAVAWLGIGLGAGVLLVGLFVRWFAVGFLGRRLPHRGAVVESEHDDDGVGLLGGQDALGGRGPVGRIALGLIPDQAGDGLVSADHAHVGLFGIGVLKAA